MTRGRPRLHRRFEVLVALSGLPATAVALGLVLRSDLSPAARLLLGAVAVVPWAGLVLVIGRRSRYHLRTLSNLLAALREGDYSFRARSGSLADPYGEVVAELNRLTETLRYQRVDELEATALVRKVMAEIDVAVFVFDASHRLRQVNAAGERLYGGSPVGLGASAAELGLDACLSGPAARTVELEIGGVAGRWEMRRGSFREHGRPTRLLVLSDVSRALKAEELVAWKRLIRVIGHELNNSLAPITSLAGSLERVVSREPLPEDWRSDLGRGLQVIGSRVEALNRFMGHCSRLARLPAPSLAAVDLAACVRDAAALEERLEVAIEGGPTAVVAADRDQLEQVLINLIRNAVEASQEGDSIVTVHWVVDDHTAAVVIRDDGPGLPHSGNLFVPFFTTKQNGSGVGLFLCRQVVEAHGGTISVRNRRDGPGCEATVRLPLHRA